MDSSRNFMQVSLIFIIFRRFFENRFFSNPGFFKIRGFSKSGLEKKRFFDILTSKKYGVNDPSGISHICLSSKWHFFRYFLSVFAKKRFLGIFDKQKVWRERPFGHITFLSELKMAFFLIFYQLLPKNGFFAQPWARQGLEFLTKFRRNLLGRESDFLKQ